MAQFRSDWADIGKGVSIILVVYGHAALGVSRDVAITPWVYNVITEPLALFRMPLFFFVSGVFAAKSIQRTWPEFIERPLNHLVYIFVVWNVIHYLTRIIFSRYSNTSVDIYDLLYFPVFPLDVTWFILALAAYYCLLKLLKDVPRVFLVLAAGAVALMPVSTDFFSLDKLHQYFIFFVLGCWLSERVRALDGRPNLMEVMGLLVIFAAAGLGLTRGQFSDSALVVLFFQCFGVTAVIAFCMWLATDGRHRWLSPLGENTLSIFVMHTIFAGAIREILLRLDVTGNPFALIFLCTTFGVLGPLAASVIMRRAGFPWLLERPHWLHLNSAMR